MTKKKKIIIAIAILSCILLSLIGGESFSKYVSEIKGSATAQIAKWYFKVNGETEQIQNITLASAYNYATIKKGTIAPGAKGSFNIVVDCTEAEVGVEYSIKFQNETTKPTNLKFEFENHKCNNLSELEEFLATHINRDDEFKKITYTIKWEWPFETGETEEEKASNNKIDTQESQTITNYSFDIIVTGTQMQPRV